MSTLSERGLRPVAELAADRPQVTLRYLSVCSGIEAATVAWHPLGWQPVAFSEIEPFPSAVLAHHYPNVPNLGDMTRFEEWPVKLLAEVDILVGGSPCQAFSVAGKRESLADARGNLSLTYIKLLEAIDEQRSRAGRPPAICVWENVPGVLSTKDNAFGCFLAGLVGEEVPLQAPRGKWKDAGVVVGPERLAAWRILDAQFFGVAQRRRRVFLVSVSLRHPRAWACAAALLPLIESVRRDTPPSREARQGAAASVGGGVASGGVPDVAQSVAFVDVGATLKGGSGARGYPDPSDGNGHNMVAQLVPDVAPTLDQRAGRSGENSFATSGGLVPVAQPIPFRKSRRAQSVDDHETWVEDGVSNTLNCFDVGDVRAVDVVAQPVAYGIDGEQNASEELIGTLRSHQSGGYEGARVAQPVATDLYNGAIDGDATHSLRVGNGNAMGGVPSVMQPVAFSVCPDHCGGDKSGQDVAFVNVVDVSRTLDCTGADVARKQGGIGIATAMQVRRLTPVECERLQGFPDGYTNIPWRKKDEAPDGPRYKALGNSMAVPCMAWIGKRIAEVDRGD